MTKRPHIPLKQKLMVLIQQSRHIIPCPLCGGHLGGDLILEHMIPRAWTESDGIFDLAYVHKSCADLKTYGNKATCAGGDLHKIAKAKRLAKARDELKAVLSGEKQKQPGAIKSRPFGGWRKFDGSIVRK